MRKALAVMSFALAIAFAGNVFAAGDKPKREKAPAEKPTKVTGDFVSAAVPAGATDVKWTLSVEGAESPFEIAPSLVVLYAEKDGQKVAKTIRAAGKKTPDAKGKTLVAVGTFKSATLAADKVTLTLSVGEGVAATDVSFDLTKPQVIMSAKKGDKVLAVSISSSAPAKGERVKGQGKGGKKNKGGEVPGAPGNL